MKELMRVKIRDFEDVINRVKDEVNAIFVDKGHSFSFSIVEGDEEW